MSYVNGLQCRECERTYDIAAMHVCEFCFGPLEVVYDYDGSPGAVSRATIAAGSAVHLALRGPAAGPAGHRSWTTVSTSAPASPRSCAPPRLGAELGLRDLWLKNDTVNPTVLVQGPGRVGGPHRRPRLGFDTAACASTGNLANSVAAHAARRGCGLRLRPLRPRAGEDRGQCRLRPEPRGDQGQLRRREPVVRRGRREYGWAFVNVNVRPYYAEGSKTIGFEIAEQLGWQLPDHVVAPMASGAMLVKIDKAFGELVEGGAHGGDALPGLRRPGDGLLADRRGAEGRGPARSVRWARHDREVPWRSGTPPTATTPSRRWAHRWGMEDVSDEDVVDAMQLLARTEGIFGETAAGVTVAVPREGSPERASSTRGSGRWRSSPAWV
jgi:threonine synthase